VREAAVFPEELTVAEKRALLEQFLDERANRGGHDSFATHDGRGFEGYILEVGEATVTFVSGPSPFDGPWTKQEPFEIPISSIKIDSLW
jgi:hypothetical protein